jgi:hypothetical protein
LGGFEDACKSLKQKGLCEAVDSDTTPATKDCTFTAFDWQLSEIQLQKYRGQAPKTTTGQYTVKVDDAGATKQLQNGDTITGQTSRSTATVLRALGTAAGKTTYEISEPTGHTRSNLASAGDTTPMFLFDANPINTESVLGAEYWTTMPATVVPDIGACSRSDPAAPCLAANTAGCKATAMGFEDACVGLNAKAACEAVNSDSKTATQDCAFVPNAAAAGAAVDGLTTTAWNVPATATVRAAPRGPHRRKLYRVGPNCGPT